MRHTVAATLLLLPFYTLAQKPTLTHHPLNPAEVPAKDTSLPVTRVSLYKNGVGFFEHTGSVSGNASVTIDFTSGQLNDVLQSLTAIDLNGGRISGAGYNSTTPLDQQLKNLPINLAENPTAADFYAAIRGARVEVHSGAAVITGRLLSVESRDAPTKSADDNNTPAAQRFYLTVISDAGDVRTLELTPATSVRLTDTALHTDVTRYLQLIDANRNQGLRHLTLQDLAPEGSASKAPRELHLSYISEVPIWKSTYRILFTDNKSSGGPSNTTSGGPANTSSGGPFTAEPHPAVSGKPQTSDPAQTATLQGWSVVDNTTGTDWINVHLSLIAGSPQSFIQPLSQPIYSRRPEIPIAQEAQLSPQTHDSSIDSISSSDTATVAASPQMALAAKARSANGFVGGVLGGTGSGIGAGSGGNMGGGVFRGGALGSPVITYETLASNSLATSTTTAAFDDYFAYNLTEPVTIRKNESALVPILQAKVTADRVTLVSSNGYNLSQPLRALWVTNTSGLTLDRGSFTIVENGAFGGEGLLDPIHPNEKRLLSYAADQAIHVSTEANKTNSRVTSLSGSKGVLILHNAELHEITYVIHNAAAEPRTVVLEEPVVNGFTLDSATPTNGGPASSDPKPTETTATVYRFRVEVPSGQTVRLHSGARRNGFTTYRLTNSDDNQFKLILSQSEDNPTLIAALQPILDARRKVADAQTAVNQTKQHIETLRSDEDRQRSNITALAISEKSSKQRFVDDLNRTEDALKAAQTDLNSRTSALEAAQSELANRIESFQIDTKI